MRVLSETIESGYMFWLTELRDGWYCCPERAYFDAANADLIQGINHKVHSIAEFENIAKLWANCLVAK